MLPQDSDAHWEDAYRGLVAELESKERRWTAVEADLRHAATALAISAMGESDERDTLLQRIVDLARDATDPLGPEVDQLRTLLRDDSRPPAARRDDTRPNDMPPNDTPSDMAGASHPTEALLDLRIVVNALIGRLAAIPDLADVAEQIDAQCDNDDWSAALNNVADSIAQVVSSLHAERRELEEFIGVVTAQLTGFERWMRWHLNETKQRRDDNANLEQAVKGQVDDLNAVVESTDDIGQLKATVQTRLQAVTQRVRTFTQSEARRLSEAEARNAALASEVNRLRKRTSELDELCGDQRNRLMLDALTRVHSRYAYEQRLQEEIQTSRSNGTPLSFTLWDIDRFKSINDTFGHDAGDRLLRRVGLIINKYRRREDFAARIGGEEFVVLLPGADIAAATGIAERLREAVAATPFNYHGERQPVTISCGVTQLRDDDTAASLYKRADEALYKAKDRGRNRVVGG